MKTVLLLISALGLITFTLTFPCEIGSCRDSETCCPNYRGTVGCCPGKYATCCADKLTCCPYGYNCNLLTRTCSVQKASALLTLIDMEENEDEKVLDIPLLVMRINDEQKEEKIEKCIKELKKLHRTGEFEDFVAEKSVILRVMIEHLRSQNIEIPKKCLELIHN